MGKTTPLRQALKRTFFPYLVGKGFSTDMRHAPGIFAFRRVDGVRLLLCEVQWDKYGSPRFAINFGVCSAHGVEFYGEHVPAAEVTASQASQWGRLLPGNHATTRGWFRQDRTIVQRVLAGSRLRAPDEVVRELMILFGEVEEFWQSGRVGRHIQVFENRSEAAQPSAVQ